MEDDAATLTGQFYEFSRLMDNKRSGLTINLWRSDYWMRQCKLLEDRKLTMSDTGCAWFKSCKTELTFDEWHEFLTEICQLKGMNQELTENILTNCGLPGTTPVVVPQFRDFFDTYKPKSKLMF